MEELYVQLTRHKEGARICMVEDQLDRAFNEAGIDLVPTKRMTEYAWDLAEKQGVVLPEACRIDFESCRDFLNKWSGRRGGIEDETFDFGLEKVGLLIDSLSRRREKANVLDYEIEECREFGKEREMKRIPSPEKENIVAGSVTGKRREATKDQKISKDRRGKPSEKGQERELVREQPQRRRDRGMEMEM